MIAGYVADVTVALTLLKLACLSPTLVKLSSEDSCGTLLQGRIAVIAFPNAPTTSLASESLSQNFYHAPPTTIAQRESGIKGCEPRMGVHYPTASFLPSPKKTVFENGIQPLRRREPFSRIVRARTGCQRHP